MSKTSQKAKSAEKTASSPTSPAPASPTAVQAANRTERPSSTVHPLARRVAGLFAPMSLRDQKTCYQWCQTVLYGAGLLLYPVAWYLESFRIFAYGVLGAAALCCVLCLPNWLQRPDPDVTYVDSAVTAAFYAKLEKAREELAAATQ